MENPLPPHELKYLSVGINQEYISSTMEGYGEHMHASRVRVQGILHRASPPSFFYSFCQIVECSRQVNYE